MKKCSFNLLASLALIFPINQAAAIDLQPGDLVALPVGLNLVQVSYLKAEYGGRYSHDRKLPLDTKVESAQFIARVGRTFEIDHYPAIFYVQTPIGYLHPGNDLSGYQGDSGVGDTSMLLAFWPYANREAGQYVAIGAYLTIPTGSYDATRLFNMGESRYKSSLQAGYSTAISEKFTWSAAADSTWFTDNNNYLSGHYKREQDALLTLQTALQYRIDATYAIGATYFYTSGGETNVGGLDQHDKTDLQRFQLTATGQYAFGRLTVQYGRDLKTENGFIEDSRWILRYTKLF